MSRTVFSRVRIAVLVVGVSLLSAHLGVAPATAAPKEDPFLGVTPNWDKKISGASRFTVLADFNNEAVRDNETGLVWERSPSSLVTGWVDAITVCLRREVAGRKGWHLPMIEQLSSLVDTTGAGALPSGNPFQNISTTFPYWSATTSTFNQANAWGVEFNSNGNLAVFPKPSGEAVWCVRGGQSFDGNTP